MALTKKQLAALQVARRQLALSDDEYRAILRDATGASSSKAPELDGMDFELLIARFASLGWKPGLRSAFYGFRRGMATPSQLALIRALWGEFTDRAGTDSTLGKWLHRTFGVSSPRFVTAALAPKAIAALRAMVDRRREGAAGTGDDRPAA